MKYAETQFVKKYEPDREAVVQLTNGRFVDVLNGCFFDPDARIMIKGHRIAAILGIDGEQSDIAPDYSIDLQGKTAMPSLFNTHCHVAMAVHTLTPRFKDAGVGRRHRARQIEKSLSECLVHGITNIRDAYNEDLGVMQTLSERIARGEISGPRILQAVAVVPSGSYIATMVSYLPKVLRRVLDMPTIDHGDRHAGVLEFPADAEAALVRDCVDRAVDERDAGAIKIGEEPKHPVTEKPLANMTMEQFRALVDQARTRGLRTMMHCTSVESFRRGIEAGVTSFSHLPWDGPLTAEDADAFVNAECIIEPTVSVLYSGCWRIKGEPSRDDPDMDRLSEYRVNTATFAEVVEEYFVSELRGSVLSYHERSSSGVFRVLGIVDGTKAFRRNANSLSHAVGNLRKLVRRGAIIALGNDGGVVPPCTPATVSLELSLLNLFLNRTPEEPVLGGADVLRIATVNSACCMGLDSQFGTLETGKIADIVVVDGDPFKDSSVVGSRAAALFLDGRMVINNCGLRVEPARIG